MHKLGLSRRKSPVVILSTPARGAESITFLLIGLTSNESCNSTDNALLAVLERKSMKKIEFTIPGPPKGKDRPQFNRQTGTVFTPTPTKHYEQAVQSAYMGAGRMYMAEKDQPMAIYVTAFFEIPSSDTKKKKERKLLGFLKPVKKPDVDNILKVVMDGLNGIAYPDDKQIVDARVKKRYSSEPRVEVTLMEVAE